MAGGRLGTVFVELSLDDKVYRQKLGETLTSTQATAKGIETSWRTLGTKTDAIYDQQRRSYQNALTLIKNSTDSTKQDIIRAEQAAAAKIKAINEQQFGHQTTLLESIKSNWLAVAAVVAVAYKAIGAVSDIVMAAARYETLGVVMRTVGTNAGYTSEQMEGFAKGLEKTGISMSGSRETLTRMAQAHLDLSKATQLGRVAQDAAVIGNVNSTEAFQRLVYGIQSAQVEMLRTIGINVNFENSYQKVAKETGRTTTSFSEAEKAAIRMNVVLDAGAGIAGTYEAAMGTAGKQLLSLERHFDNLKVLVGAAFTPALAEIIEIITGAVVSLNDELSGDSKEAIESWGVAFRVGIISIEAEFMRLAMLLDKIGGTMTSAQMLLYGPGAALGVESSTKRFAAAAEANMMYERRYEETSKALEALAIKQINLENSLTKAGKATAKAMEAKAEAAKIAAIAAGAVNKAEGQTAEELKKTMKAMEALIPIAAKWGEEKLKMSKSAFSEVLKKEGASIKEMRTGLDAYLTTLKDVYSTRIEGEKAIAEAMKKAGGKPEEAMKAQLEALKQEEQWLVQRKDGWQKYYDTLSALHAKATDLMKSKTAELLKLENDAAVGRQNYANLLLNLQEKLIIAKGKAATDESIYLMKLKAVEQARDEANRLSGDAQIKALEKVRDQYAALTGAVTVQWDETDKSTGKQITRYRDVVTAQEAIGLAMKNVMSVQEDITLATNAGIEAKKAEIAVVGKWQKDLATEMEKAKKMVDEYTEKIVALSEKISKMERDIAVTITLNDKVSAPLAALNAALDAATKTRTVSVVAKVDSSSLSLATRQIEAAIDSSRESAISKYASILEPAVGGSRTSAINEYVPGEMSMSYSSSAGGYSGGTSQLVGSGTSHGYPEFEGYATGLPYVPRDNFKARLHEGEAVLTKEEAESWRKGKGGQVINFNPSINVVGANKSPEQLAREIVKPLKDEMRRLAAVN